MNFPEAERFQTMLVEQYRMNSLIMQWSSSHLYDGRLVAHPSVGDRVLSDIITTKTLGIEGAEGEETKIEQDEIDQADVIQNPLIYIDTAGSLMYEAVD